MLILYQLDMLMSDGSDHDVENLYELQFSDCSMK